VRRLRTNLQFINVAKKSKAIVITSSIPGEGKSTIAMNLAVSLADSGVRTILIDANLRQPALDEYLGIESGLGLATVLIGQARIQDVIQPLGDNNFDLLPAGQVHPNSSELLGSAAMNRLLEELLASYGVVLLDCPPLLPVTDAAVLSKMASGALVIIDADRVHRPQLQAALESLDAADGHVLGLIMNKVKRAEAGAYLSESSYMPLEKSRKPASGQPVPGSGLPQQAKASRPVQSRRKLQASRSHQEKAW
jgi:capsular exopolysaccharide synthesis family protein